MRLWHKDLIHILPRQQLLGQWRECCAIAKNIAEKGMPGNILVNRIMDYPIEHFTTYGWLVRSEMVKRKYKVDYLKFHKYLLIHNRVNSEELFQGWHNERYLIQCLHNLQEKYDCGGISEKEWDIILKEFPAVCL